MKRYDYQPGNATRYDLLYGPIEGTQTYAIVLLNGAHEARGGSMTFNAASRPSKGYIEAAMRLTYGGDADALAQFIAERHPERMAAHKAAS